MNFLQLAKLIDDSSIIIVIPYVIDFPDENLNYQEKTEQ